MMIKIKTVHDVPFMPVRRLHHSQEAIFWELSQLSSHQYDQSSTPSCGDGVFSVERPDVKRKLVNIWNSKLEAQGGNAQVHAMCSQKKNLHQQKLGSFLDSGIKWWNFPRDYKRYWNRES